MSSNRRDFSTKLSSLSASHFAVRTLLSAQSAQYGFVTLDIADLRLTIDNFVKVFNLIAKRKLPLRK